MPIRDFYCLHFVTSIAGKPSPSLWPAFKSSGRVQADLQDRPSLYTQVSPFDFLHTHLATDVLPGLLGTKILSLISLPQKYLVSKAVRPVLAWYTSLYGRAVHSDTIALNFSGCVLSQEYLFKYFPSGKAMRLC